MASENENRRVLETILHDDVIFKKISDKVFSYIDIDNNGTIDRGVRGQGLHLYKNGDRARQ